MSVSSLCYELYRVSETKHARCIMSMEWMEWGACVKEVQCLPRKSAQSWWNPALPAWSPHGGLLSASTEIHYWSVYSARLLLPGKRMKTTIGLLHRNRAASRSQGRQLGISPCFFVSSSEFDWSNIRKMAVKFRLAGVDPEDAIMDSFFSLPVHVPWTIVVWTFDYLHAPRPVLMQSLSCFFDGFSYKRRRFLEAFSHEFYLHPCLFDCSGRVLAAHIPSFIDCVLPSRRCNSLYACSKARFGIIIHHKAANSQNRCSKQIVFACWFSSSYERWRILVGEARRTSIRMHSVRQSIPLHQAPDI